MRTTQIIIVLTIFSVSTFQINAQNYKCKDLLVGGVCIDIEFISVKDDLVTPSEYKFPDLVKINDYLIINRITIINKDSRNYSNLTLKIDIYPLEFKNKGAKFREFIYSELRIPTLNVNDVYEVTYLNKHAYYEIKLNNKTIRKGDAGLYPTKLFTDGNWIIETDLKENRESISYTDIINGKWRNYFFKVYSNSEITNLEIAKRSLRISLISVVIMAIIGIATIGIQLIIGIIQYILQKRYEF